MVGTFRSNEPSQGDISEMLGRKKALHQETPELAFKGWFFVLGSLMLIGDGVVRDTTFNPEHLMEPMTRLLASPDSVKHLKLQTNEPCNRSEIPTST